MPSIKVYQINNYISDYPIIEIEYDFGDTLVKKIVSDYNPQLNEKNAQIVIGNDVFHSWNVAVDSCLMYGDFILIRTDCITIIIRFGDKEVKIKNLFLIFSNLTYQKTLWTIKNFNFSAKCF